MNPQQPQPVDPWTSAEAYEAYVGRWSRLVAAVFIQWLSVPASGRWLDVGCGTGTLSRTILARADPSAVLGVDRSEQFLAFAREQLTDPRVSFEVGDARALPVPDGAFDAAVTGLVLNFVPAADQLGAVAEMARSTHSGGVVAAYVWDYAAGMQMMRHFWDAAVELDPEARKLVEGLRFPLCQPEPLATLFRDAGLRDVETRSVDIPTVFRDFDDYWSPFLGANGPAPAYAMSLGEDQRVALRERIRSGLPFAPDGSIPLTARAWAVRGSR
jgi:SAM-dependent methyltransferase